MNWDNFPMSELNQLNWGFKAKKASSKMDEAFFIVEAILNLTLALRVLQITY